MSEVLRQYDIVGRFLGLEVRECVLQLDCVTVYRCDLKQIIFSLSLFSGLLWRFGEISESIYIHSCNIIKCKEIILFSYRWILRSSQINIYDQYYEPSLVLERSINVILHHKKRLPTFRLSSNYCSYFPWLFAPKKDKIIESLSAELKKVKYCLYHNI